MKRSIAVLTAALCLALAAPSAHADRKGAVVFGGGPVVVARPAYRPYVVDLAPAPVVRVVPAARQECWDEVVRYGSGGYVASATPTILGGILGGVAGNQFGSGSGNTAMTVAGALLGASIGHDLTPKAGYVESVPVMQRRCRTVYSGYDAVVAAPPVTYVRPGRYYAPPRGYYRGARVRVIDWD